MERSDQADHAEQNHADSLQHAHRAGFQADDMFQVQRSRHQQYAADECQEKQRTRAGQVHGGSGREIEGSTVEESEGAFQGAP